MNTLKFKTNIKCTGCIETIKPELNKLQEVKNWKVDLESPDKTLTVEATNEEAKQKVIDALKEAGYTGQPQN